MTTVTVTSVTTKPPEVTLTLLESTRRRQTCSARRGGGRWRTNTDSGDEGTSGRHDPDCDTDADSDTEMLTEWVQVSTRRDVSVVRGHLQNRLNSISPVATEWKSYKQSFKWRNCRTDSYTWLLDTGSLKGKPTDTEDNISKKNMLNVWRSFIESGKIFHLAPAWDSTIQTRSLTTMLQETGLISEHGWSDKKMYCAAPREIKVETFWNRVSHSDSLATKSHQICVQSFRSLSRHRSW